MARWFVFDDWRSVGHFMLGAITAQLKIFAIIPILIFILYENREKEQEKNKIGDYIEFLAGFCYGLALTSR